MTNKKGSSTLSSFSYTYYATGSQKSKKDKSGKVTSYTYDGLGRLTKESESGGVTLSYAYDRNGNRTSLTVTGTEKYTTAYTYNAANQLLSSTKTKNGTKVTTTYTYDANGNMLTETSPSSQINYTYNALGQLDKVSLNGVSQMYTYNAQGIRVAKTAVAHKGLSGIDGKQESIGNTTLFLLDGGNVAAEIKDDAVAGNYVWGANLILNKTNNSYYLYNAHGDVVNLTSSSGSVTKSYDYDAFGNEKSPNASDTNPFRYCGEYFDKETGTYYLRARYYNSGIGRFMQEDPIRDGFNWYAYCNGNPITFCDPTGTETIALRATIEALGGTVIWNNTSKTATVYLDGKTVKVFVGDGNGSFVENGKLYTDDGWLFAALATTFDLGQGWTGRFDRQGSGKGFKKHLHIYKGDKSWTQNEDGTPHDKGNNSKGSPPRKILEKVKKEYGWDWEQKEKDWLNRIKISLDPAGYTYINYPNGRVVTVYKASPLMSYYPSNQALKDYLYGPTYIYLGGSSVNSSINPFILFPTPIPFPVIIPTPIPVF